MMRPWFVFGCVVSLFFALAGAPGAEAEATDNASAADDLPLSVDTVPEPAGYRMDDYRSPVPSSLTGGTVADLKDKRLGIVAGTPPGTYLARAGLIGKAKPYQLMVDTRFDNSAKSMMDDLEAGEIDGAVLWGPLAGWYAKEASKDYKVIPLVNEGAGPAMAYRITMGVRSADQQWKRTLNVAIRDNQDAINEILLSYGVPLLDENDKPLQSKTASATNGAAPQAGQSTDKETSPASETGAN